VIEGDGIGRVADLLANYRRFTCFPELPPLRRHAVHRQRFAG